ncbi:MAG: AMP-binding protein [Acidimicrobiia bacterium]
MTQHQDLGRWMRDKAQRWADVEIEVTGRATTYGGLDAGSDRLARGLRALGVAPGESLCVMLPNCAEALDLWFASVKAGTVEVPVNTAYVGYLLRHIITTVQPAAFVCDESVLDNVVAAIRDAGPTIRHLVVRRSGGTGTGEDRARPELAGVAVHDLADLYLDGTTTADGPAPHTRLVMFTSGTTGPSKGAAVGDGWCLTMADKIIEVMSYGPSDRLYSMFQLFHGNSRFTTILPALSVGAGFVLDERFSASRFWDICRAKDITAFSYLGAVIPMLWKQPARDDDADNPVRIAFGLACPADVWEPFEQRFGLHLVEGYGLTEVGLAICNQPGDSRLGSCGKPIDDSYEIELHDEHDEPVPVGVAGECVLRPRRPGVLFNGYHNMPEATLQAFRNLWFHTGDRLRQDEDGYFYFVDRVKESMRRRGMNVSSWEVEQVVNGLDEVLESAAYGVPSELAEEEVMVAVVARPGQDVDPAAVVEHCRRNMAEFAVPRYVRVVAALPKTPTERVEKYRLKEEGVTPDTWDRTAAAVAS